MKKYSEFIQDKETATRNSGSSTILAKPELKESIILAKPELKESIKPIIKPKEKIETPIKDDIEFFGKVVKFPKNTQPSKNILFLENKKIDKNKLHFIITENNNDIVIVKYNEKSIIKLDIFVKTLIQYYNNKLLEKVTIDGEGNYTIIKNIPTESIQNIKTDIINLLSK